MVLNLSEEPITLVQYNRIYVYCYSLKFNAYYKTHSYEQSCLEDYGGWSGCCCLGDEVE